MAAAVAVIVAVVTVTAGARSAEAQQPDRVQPQTGQIREEPAQILEQTGQRDSGREIGGWILTLTGVAAAGATTFLLLDDLDRQCLRFSGDYCAEREQGTGAGVWTAIYAANAAVIGLGIWMLLTAGGDEDIPSSRAAATRAAGSRDALGLRPSLALTDDGGLLAMALSF